MNIAVYMTISDHVFSPENSFRAFLFSKLNLNLNEGQSELRFANTCLIKTLLLRTLLLVPTLNIFSKFNPLTDTQLINTDTFCGPLSVRINVF